MYYIIGLLMLRKSVVTGIILLFLISSFLPSINSNGLIIQSTIYRDSNVNPMNQKLHKIDGGEILKYVEPYKILFIGSSYFNFNNLPYLFEKLVISSGKEIYIDHYGRNGLYLDDHASSSATESKINEQKWDYVILQGGGPNTAYPEYFTDHPVYPALEILWDKIHQNCGSTKMIFCLPWAFEDGMTWYKDWTDTYADMQIKILENTLRYSNEIGFGIAPVGWSWYMVLEEKNYPLHYLHMSDWNHPSLKGSYLMACVIFSTVFLESSVNILYHGGLLEEEGSYFQTVASHTVLDNLSLWNIVDEGDNNPPDKPEITGPISGKAGEEYDYTFSSVDPDGDAVQFYIEWGDGNSEWTGFNSSGDSFTRSHIYDEKDTYVIRAKAKDSKVAESDWATIEVSMPRNKAINPQANIWFFWGRFKTVDEDEDYVYQQVINATFIGIGGGIYTYGLSNNIEIKMLKPYHALFGFMIEPDEPFFTIGFCRHWDYVI